jgi:hypothetical protein
MIDSVSATGGLRPPVAGGSDTNGPDFGPTAGIGVVLCSGTLI